MNDLNKCYRDAVMIIREAGIRDFIEPTSIKWTNLCHAWGRTYWNKDYVTRITISRKLKDVPYEGIMSTVIHECLHSCKQCIDDNRYERVGHTKTWYNYSVLVNHYLKAHGYNFTIKERSTSQDHYIDDAYIGQEVYTSVCTCCGKKIGQVAYKMPKWASQIKHGYIIEHRNCNGFFKELRIESVHDYAKENGIKI